MVDHFDRVLDAISAAPNLNPDFVTDFIIASVDANSTEEPLLHYDAVEGFINSAIGWLREGKFPVGEKPFLSIVHLEDGSFSACVVSREKSEIENAIEALRLMYFRRMLDGDTFASESWLVRTAEGVEYWPAGREPYSEASGRTCQEEDRCLGASIALYAVAMSLASPSEKERAVKISNAVMTEAGTIH